MIVAKLESRVHVPDDVIAIKFADIKFFGDQRIVKNLETAKHLVEFHDYKKYQVLIDFLEAKVLENKNDIDMLERDLKNLKRNFLSAYLISENRSQMKKTIELIERKNMQNAQYRNQINKYQSKRFTKTKILEDNFTQMLVSLGFKYRSTTKDETSLTKVTIFDYEGSEIDLFGQVENLIKDLRSKESYNVRLIQEKLNGIDFDKIQIKEIDYYL